MRTSNELKWTFLFIPILLSQACSGCDDPQNIPADGDLSDADIFDGDIQDGDLGDADGEPDTDTDGDVQGITPIEIEYQEDTISSPLSPSPLDRTVPTDLYEATRFLYAGGSPPQAGVAPGTIRPDLVAVLRGRVSDQGGAGFSGVEVSVLDHPEYGSTVSRDDGGYDLVVNGGERLTATFVADGFFSAQRSSHVPTGDYLRLSDVRLVELTGASTSVDPASSGQVEVVSGVATEDQDGSRQTHMLFPPGTLTSLVTEAGEEPLDEALQVRVNEYTVGDGGAETMPGELPPSSGYTYAVELSLDQAGFGEEVSFSQPVPVYVENFLDFPVGGAVPVGSYDSSQGAWVPERNGRVIEIVGEAGGVAEVDADGDGAADPAAMLESLGITDGELGRLAGLYEPGQSLWRFAVTHLSPWDCNWPYGPPDDAEPPGLGLYTTQRADGSCQTSGSVIECDNQILGENVPIVGTGLELVYRSDRVPGYRAAYTVDIPLSGPSLPASLAQIILEVRVAGRTFRSELEPEPDLVVRYTWDGRDAYGRLTQGAQPTTVRVGYVYPGVYQTPADFEESFAAFSGVPMSSNETRQEVVLWQETQTTLGPWDAFGLGLGGFSLSGCHVYDPAARRMYMGSGELQESAGLPPVITTFAGNGNNDCAAPGVPAHSTPINHPLGVAAGPDGSVYISECRNIRRVTPGGMIENFAGNGDLCDSGADPTCGDGNPAVTAPMSPERLAVGPRGHLYFSDDYGTRVRRVRADGIVETVAGSGAEGFDGDHGPAPLASFYEIAAIALAPDGTVYVADSGNHRVRRVSPAGIVTTAVGTGESGYSGDDGPAALAELNVPTALAIGPDGSLYIGDSRNRVIRRVGPDGFIRTIAGNGERCDDTDPDYCGDGGPALDAAVDGVTAMVVDRSGIVYFADPSRRVRRVTPDGIVSNVAGCGFTTDDPGDGGPATAAGLSTRLYALALDSAGALYIVDNWEQRVRKVATPLRGVSLDEYAIPDRRGGVVYVFDRQGRHERTLSTLTGETLTSLAYDDDGLLESIIDGDGNEVRIDRGGGGTPRAIVAPFGQRTELSLNADGYVEAVTNALGEAQEFEYTGPEGLLRLYRSPGGSETSLTFDDLGRLETHLDTEGRERSFERLILGRDGERTSGTLVRLTTTLGQQWTFLSERIAGGSTRRKVTAPGGVASEMLIGPDGSRQVLRPDGTVLEWSLEGDPRFGLAVPYVSELAVTTPSGLCSVFSATKQATLTDPGDLLSVETLTTELEANGLTTTTVYDGLSRGIATTTPGGITVAAELDNQGRVLSTDIPGLAAAEVSYDSFGRIESITAGEGADARVTEVGFDPAEGWATSLTSPLRETWDVARDVVGRPEVVTGPDDEPLGFDHDAEGNLVGISPPGRAEHGFVFDGQGRQLRYTPPEVDEPEQEATEYDQDGRPAAIRFADGTAVTFAYSDTTHRMESLTTEDGTTRFDYDGATGQLTSAQSPSGQSLRFAYDGFLTTSLSAAGEVTGEVSFGYDEQLRMDEVRVAGELAYDVEYNADSQPSRAGDLSLTWSGATGFPQGTTLHQVISSVSFDNFGVLRTETYRHAGTVLFEQDVTETDANARIVELVEAVASETTRLEYEYNTAGRLEQVSRNGAVTDRYFYDANGNLERHENLADGTTTDATFDAQDRILTHGSTTFEWNARGQLESQTTAGQTTELDYDQLGALRVVTLPDGMEIEYIIGPSGRRLGRRVDGTRDRGWLYGGGLSPVAELDDTGAVVATFTYAGGHVPEAMVRGGQTYRIIKDIRGSVRLVVNAETGEIAQRLDYGPWGQVLRDTNPGFQPFGYTGGLYDPDTGLTRMGARDYDPRIGRWTARDPILFEGGQPNLYVYTYGDPINHTDPTGLLWDAVIDGVSIGYDIYRLVADNILRDCDNLWSNLASLALDIAGLALPFATGLGMAYRASRAARGAGRAVNWGVCFAAGTLVATCDGELIPIEDVAQGDLALSYDVDADTWQCQEVHRTFARQHEGQIVVIDVAGETIEATAEHPFLVESDGQWIWVDAGQLLAGDWLVLASGSQHSVEAVRSRGVSQPVYNLEVGQTHTYSVGSHGFVVHNMCAASRVGDDLFETMDRVRDACPGGFCSELSDDLIRALGRGTRVDVFPAARGPLPTLPGVTDVPWSYHSVVRLPDQQVVDPLRRAVFGSWDDFLSGTFAGPVVW